MQKPYIAITAAIIAALLWGGNFVAIKVSLHHFDMFTFTIMRFIVIAMLIPFVGWPKVPAHYLIMFSLATGLGQYLASTAAVALGLSPGIAALFMQFQVFFSLFFSWLLLKEQVQIKTIIGSVLGLIGLMGVLLQGSQYAPLLASIVCISAAASWALGNILLRKMQASILKLQAASAGLSIPIVLLFIPFFDTHPLSVSSFTELDGMAWLALLYAIFASFTGAQLLWGSAIRSLGINKIAPISLLIPVFGVTLSWWLLNETLSLTVMMYMFVVLLGVGTHFYPWHQRKATV